MDQLKRTEEMVSALLKVIFALDADVNASMDAMGINVEIASNNRDKMGMVMGKGGRNLDALRRLVRIWGFLNKARVNLFIKPDHDQAQV